MGLFDKLITKAGEGLVSAAGKAIDSVFTNDEERMKQQAVLDQVKNDFAKEVNRHLEALDQAALKEIELEIQDRVNARLRETDFVKSTGHMDYMMIAVGSLVMLAFIGTLVMIGFRKLPEGSEHLMINAIGILEGMVLSVVGYYFGSSAGSRIKDMRGK